MIRKSLGLFAVISIATGSMISSGFFLLPGIAYAEAGPAVVLSYFIAALLMIPSLFSAAELSSAMPRAGGTYFFVSRTMGPLAGVVEGFGGWLGMVAKGSFALVGVGYYLTAAAPGATPEVASESARVIAAALALVLGALNLWGTKETGAFQTALVIGLVALSALFVIVGAGAFEPARFRPFAPLGAMPVLATAGLVFVSYAGLTQVASVSEELTRPERDIPLGMFIALGMTAAIYCLGVATVVGVMPGAELAEDTTPLASAAARFAGTAGMVAMTVAGTLAFVTTANAGVMSSARYLFALGRDGVLPGRFARLTSRETPALPIAVSTLAMIAVAVFLEADGIARFASTVLLVSFGAMSLAVIVIRESKIGSYDPSFHSPLYPWLQIMGIAVSVVMIAVMGRLAVSYAFALLAASVAWYFAYARGRVEHAVALMRVLDRIAAQILSREPETQLDSELRSIMKEKGMRPGDPFVEVAGRARVIDLPESGEWDDFLREATRMLSLDHPQFAAEIEAGLIEAGRMGQTPAAEGVALPHMRLDVDDYSLILGRSRRGLHFPGTDAPVHAVFVLLGREADPRQHLRMLAGIARRAEELDFMARWMDAEDESELRELVLGRR